MPIVVRYVCHEDMLSDMILLRTGGEYAHAEAPTREGTVIGAYALGGVQERPLDYDGGKFKRELFLKIGVDDATSARFYHYLRAPEVLGEPYAFRDVAGFLSPFDRHDQHHVFCSALMVDALRGSAAFPAPLPIPAHCVYPVLLQQMLLTRPDVVAVERGSFWK